MNQIRKPAPPERNLSIGERLPGTGIETRDDRRDSIEYDDGIPATIAPCRDARAGFPRARTGREVAAAPCFRAPLAEIERNGVVEYDDGNPATIAADARGVD